MKFEMMLTVGAIALLGLVAWKVLAKPEPEKVAAAPAPSKPDPIAMVGGFIQSGMDLASDLLALGQQDGART